MQRTTIRTMMTAVMAWLALGIAGDVRAADHFLTIGGGYSPSGNQVSLEKNVLYFQRLLKDFGLSSAPHDILFADGNSPQRDLQFRDPNFKLPRAHELLAILNNQTHGLRNQYRSNAVPHVRGMSSPQQIDAWFNSVGKKLGKDDRLFIYLTGHGGRGDKGQPHNTKFFMWNSHAMKVSDFVTRLDRLAPDTPVVMVMVQCFSGGFANVVFNEGDPKKGLSKSNRCGFFATVQTRPAAGCTPDINEADYHEFSTYFWEAIYGKTRLGQSVDQPDFNGDHHIGFNEAYAYVMIHSNTIDIPVKTSDAVLRAWSRTSDKKVKDLLTADAKYADLLAAASPTDRAVLEGLSKTLGFKGDNRTKAARDLAKKTEDQRKKLAGEKSKLSKQYTGLRNGLRTALLNRWPELANPYHPQTTEVMERESAALIRFIEPSRPFKQMMKLDARGDKLDADRFNLEKKWVKCQRFIRVAENVALAANLPRFVKPEQVEQYKALLAREAGTLTPKHINKVAGSAAPGKTESP